MRCKFHGLDEGSYRLIVVVVVVAAAAVAAAVAVVAEVGQRARLELDPAV